MWRLCGFRRLEIGTSIARPSRAAITMQGRNFATGAHGSREIIGWFHALLARLSERLPLKKWKAMTMSRSSGS